MKIENVQIVNHNEVISNADIVIEGSKIKSIERKNGVGTKTLVPGFIDSHIHGFAGVDAMDSQQAIELMSKELAKFGVSGFFPTLMTSSWEKIITAIKNAAKAETIQSKILGINLEGPFVSFEKKGAHDPNFIIPATKEKIDQLIDSSKSKLSIITFAPEVNDLSLIPYMAKKGINVSLGHSNASIEIANKGIKAGANTTTHLWNGMSGVENRKSGLVTAILLANDTYAELICDLIHVDEDSIKLAIKTKTPDRIIVVSDSIAPAGLPNGEYASGGLPVIKNGDLITLKDSKSIAGGANSINAGFTNLLKMGFSLQDVVKMTSYNIVKRHNLKLIGEIKEGYFADFNILNKENQIIEIYNNGLKIK